MAGKATSVGEDAGRRLGEDDRDCRKGAAHSNQKKAWCRTAGQMKEIYPLQSLCHLFGYSRQAYYKQQYALVQRESEHSLILQQVLSIRKEQPRCGTRKLLLMLQPFLKKNHLFISRDKLFALLRANKLLVRKRKRSTYTTNSKHFFYRYP